MPTRTISLDEEAYERLKAHKRENESFSDVVKRLAGERSWTEVAGILTDEEADALEAAIVRDDDIRSGDPRIEGTRITVLDVKQRVIDGDDDPHVVAGEYDVSMAALFHALAYYYDHRDAFAEREREFAAARRDGEHRTRQLVRSAESTERAD